MNTKRLGRIESEINRVLSDAIYNGIKDNRINPSITNITKVSVRDEKTKDKIMKGLESATGYMKKRIADALDLRHTPKLIFKLDESFEKAALMNELIIKVSKEDREKRELYGNVDEEEQ